MALIADLTFIHMEALSVIDRIDRHLDELDKAGPDTQRALRTLDNIAHESVRLRQRLDGFFERERQELLPRIRRICGDELEEATTLVQTQQTVLARLDRFIAGVGEAVPDDETTPDSPLLEQRFDEFVDHFDRRCELERSFYQSFSTILFPGGVATD